MATIYYEKDGISNVLTFDATVRENMTGTAEVSDHPVEEGADRSEHVRAKRATIEVTAFVTNTPIASSGRLVATWAPMTLETLPAVVQDDGGFVQGYAPRITGGFTSPFRPPGFPRPHTPVSVVEGRLTRQPPPRVVAEVLQFLSPQDRIRDMWAALEEIRVGGLACTVFAEFAEFEGMIITSLSAPVEAQGGVTLNISFAPFNSFGSLTFSQANAKAKVAVKSAEATKAQGPKMLRTVSKPQRRSLVIRGAAAAVGAFAEDPTLAVPTP